MFFLRRSCSATSSFSTSSRSFSASASAAALAFVESSSVLVCVSTNVLTSIMCVSFRVSRTLVSRNSVSLMIISLVCSLFSDCTFSDCTFSTSRDSVSSAISASSFVIFTVRCSRVCLNSESASFNFFCSASVAAVASSRAFSSAESFRTSSAARSNCPFSSASILLFKVVISSDETSTFEDTAARRMRSTPFCTRLSLALVFSLSLSKRISSSCVRVCFKSAACDSTAAVSIFSDSRSAAAASSLAFSDASAAAKDLRTDASSSLTLPNSTTTVFLDFSLSSYLAMETDRRSSSVSARSFQAVTSSCVVVSFFPAAAAAFSALPFRTSRSRSSCLRFFSLVASCSSSSATRATASASLNSTASALVFQSLTSSVRETILRFAATSSTSFLSASFCAAAAACSASVSIAFACESLASICSLLFFHTWTSSTALVRRRCTVRCSVSAAATRFSVSACSSSLSPSWSRSISASARDFAASSSRASASASARDFLAAGGFSGLTNTASPLALRVGFGILARSFLKSTLNLNPLWLRETLNPVSALCFSARSSSSAASRKHRDLYLSGSRFFSIGSVNTSKVKLNPVGFAARRVRG